MNVDWKIDLERDDYLLNEHTKVEYECQGRVQKKCGEGLFDVKQKGPVHEVNRALKQQTRAGGKNSDEEILRREVHPAIRGAPQN